MNKKTIGILIAFVLIILALVAAIKIINKEDSVLELTYTENAGVPYEWKFEIENEEIVKFVKSYVLEDKNKEGLVGAPVSTNYVFRGLKEGTTVITFKSVGLDGNIIKVEKNKVKVDKNKNISLVLLTK